MNTLIQSLLSQSDKISKATINSLFDTNMPYRRIEKVIKITEQYREIEAGRKPTTPVYPPRTQLELISDVEYLTRKYI